MVWLKRNNLLFQKIGGCLVNTFFGLSVLLILWIVARVFFITSFKVPTGSMEPTVMPGDRVWVNKLIPGPRLFNLFAALRTEQVDIYRIPGVRKIKRNDVVVFNMPYPRDENTMEMHIMRYYIKRCIGLPGDTLQIRKGRYEVRGIAIDLGNIDAQRRLGYKDKGRERIRYCFPFDSVMGWNMLEFGPMYIPRKGDAIRMSYIHYLSYKNLIEWEMQETLTCRDSVVYLNNQPVNEYTFKKNYYFMAGDNVESSKDSRYWGLAPEEYLVGKVLFIR
ncbi:MAG: signal peptidase I [Tannerellaceae bacterium]|jgi:signal peptidase I|nr:signal peptidase I [Tannerellaceae bacterium]